MEIDKATPTPFPYKIVFLAGVDGCGKTTLAHKVIDRLNSKGIPAVHVWSRFNNYLSKIEQRILNLFSAITLYLDSFKFEKNIEKTGYVLEFNVSSLLQKHGWSVINNKYYILTIH